jgi:hypothetical protein
VFERIEESIQDLKASSSRLSEVEVGALEASRQFFSALRSFPARFARMILDAEAEWDIMDSTNRRLILEFVDHVADLRTEAREFYGHWQYLFSPDTKRVYLQDLAAYDAFASSVQQQFDFLVYRDERRGQELQDFALEQPGFREGVERARKEIAEGKSRTLSGDDFRRRIRERRER